MSDAEVFRRLSALETGMARLEPVPAQIAGHDRILHGVGAGDPGVLTGLALLRDGLDAVTEAISEFRDGQKWLRRTVVGALILNFCLMSAALLWRGTFASMTFPDLKDEVKRPPSVTGAR